jgi:hypothetical protein
MSPDKKILVVEDNKEYMIAAIRALSELGRREDIITAENYVVANMMLPKADEVITDLFFPASSRDKIFQLREEAIQKIIADQSGEKYADYIRGRLKGLGIEADEALRKSLSNLGFNNQFGQRDGEETVNAIMRFAECFEKEKDVGQRLSNIIDTTFFPESVQRLRERYFAPLKEYVKGGPNHQPLGYLVAKEAERSGKPFVIATSLRHSDGALVPILNAVRANGWKMVEGADGSKADPVYWKQAYDLLRGKK